MQHQYKTPASSRLRREIIFAFEFLLFSILYFLFSVSTVFAATLTIDPPKGSYGPGDIFVATVRIDPGVDECVNAASVIVTFPKEWLKASAFSKGESLLSLWADEPVIDNENGMVRWSGGIPAGYCGRVSGDPGQTNILGKIIFTVPGNMVGGAVATEPLPMRVAFGDDTRVLLNDGAGTPAALSLRHASYVRALASAVPSNAWLGEVENDKFPPDLFGIELVRDSNTFQGKYFIVFGTVDKQTGIHHYEVMEEDIERFGYVRGKKDKAVFHEATSPYVLLDQTLRSRITVRAYDHARNVQEVIFVPKETRDAFTPPEERDKRGAALLVGGIVFFIIIFGALLLVLRRKKKNDAFSGQ